MSTQPYTVTIDHLPEEPIDATSGPEAARRVTALIRERPSLQPLPDGEPVQIKRPDRRPWGRNLTMGDFRRGDVAAEGADEDGPVREPSIAGHHGIDPATKA